MDAHKKEPVQTGGVYIHTSEMMEWLFAGSNMNLQSF